MGRELRRKQAKKEGKSLEKEEIVEEQQIKKLIINIIIVILALAIIYLLSSLFITKELDWLNPKEADVTIEKSVSDEILASEIFIKPSEEEYYVYFYDFNEKESVITDIVNSKLSNEKVYKVNTSSAMNTNFISDTSNKKAKTLNDLKVVSPTLIKISGDTITEYYEKNEITNKLS